MSRPAQVTILGFGKIARTAHTPAWQRASARGAAVVRTIYEPSRAGCAAASVAFPTAVVIQADARSALEGSALGDIVDICTPGHLHHELVMGSLEAEADVLVEKPLAHSAAEVEEIGNAQKGAVVQVCQTLRLSPPVQRFRSALAAGHIGRISRIQVFHHGRHVLSEPEWVTQSRPDGTLFENAIHFLDLVHHLLDLTDPLTIEATRFYGVRHRPVLTGFEMFASDEAGRAVTIDFLQDSLAHSALLSRTYVSAAGSDAELRFYPDGFRLLSGVIDPLQEIRAEVIRLRALARKLLGRGDGVAPHDVFIADLLDARDGAIEPLCAPRSVLAGVATAESLSKAWATAS